MVRIGFRRAQAWAIAGLLGAALCAAAAGCRRPAPESDGSAVTISVWHPWGGTMGDPWERIVKAFEAAHPRIRVRHVFTQNDLSANQKFYTAVAASSPPEVVFVDGPQVAPWAEWGALEPLTNRMQEAGIAAEDYYTPCWLQTNYGKDVWALTFCADPNFAFVWNRALFREVGLDPDRPPRTMDELDEYAAKLTKTDDQGRLTRIGFIPWGVYGSANSMFTWGWAFGGQFYDDASRKITCTDPKVVRALEWMTSYADRYDVTKIASLQAGFGTAEQNPFYTGRLAMTCLLIAGIADIERFAPELDYGVVPQPMPEGGEKDSSWVGGWCISLPKGARHQDEGFEFIRWLCHDPEGTRVVGQETGLFPGMRHSPYFDEVRDREYYSTFLQILEACKHQRPVMPVQAFYMRQMQRAVDSAIYKQKTAKQALEDAQKATQAELDLVLRGGE